MSKLNKKGFTIAELLIAITVTTVLLMIIMNFLADSLVNYSLTEARRDLLSQAQEALDSVADEIRVSANADDDNRWPDSNSPGAPSNLYSWQSDSDTLVLATAAQDSSKNIIFSDPAQYITEKNNIVYFLSNGTLYRRILASTVSNNSSKTTCPAANATNTCPADKALVSNISSFSIKYIDGNDDEVTPTNARSIELDIDLSKNQDGHNITADYKTRMVFRND